MEIDVRRFLDTFFDEAAEHLASMEAGLLALESDPGDLERLNEIFRGAHSIKGASSTFGLTDVAQFTHGLETVLDRMRDGSIVATPPLVALLLRCTDALEALVVAAKTHGAPPEGTAALLEALQAQIAQPADATSMAVAGNVTVVADPANVSYRLSIRPDEDLFRQGMDPALLLRDLATLGTVSEVRLDRSRLPSLDHLDPESCYLSWTVCLLTAAPVSEIRDVFSFVEDACQVQIESEAAAGARDPILVASAPPAPLALAPPAAAATATRGAVEPGAGADRDRRSGADRRSGQAHETASIRVPIDKVDTLVNLVGEVVISQSMLVQALSGYTPDRLPRVLEALTEMERNTRELQDRVMAIRMVPVGSTFSRFPRMVHDLARTVGKEVTLDIVGGDTELDKGMVERLTDPLTHLIRNAVDHGLEAPDDRARAGKPATGRLRLVAAHENGNVVIEVADDGRGLDTARIRDKGLRLGLIRPDEALSDEQIHALIFHPGFSTAATVSDVSGRGVGLDVVRRNVDALNGTVAIATTPGKGTTFRIRLPLTLAILDGLQLGVGEHTFIVPLVAIIESCRPRPDEVKTVLGRGEMVVVRGEALPLLRLHRLLNLDARESDPTRALVVLFDHAGQRFGLMVDELLGQSQIVIKNLETNYERVDGIMGATIMGDGRVALILDIQGLLRLAAIGQRAA
jgi:two-component system chemotaxis sensor kinase CheA